MSRFYAEFPIDTKNSVIDVINLACTWVTGSPHSKIRDICLNISSDYDDTHISEDDDSVQILFSKALDFEIAGLRYIYHQGDLEWTVSIVTHKESSEHILGIQVLCTAQNVAVRLPKPKKPYFIKQALEVLGGGKDGFIPVGDKPIYLNDDEEKVAAALILGEAKNRLPIVYMSVGYENKIMANSDELAKKLAGMAHVVVEPTRAFSYNLKKISFARNVYGGAIGIYWPDNSGRSFYFLDDENTIDKITNKIDLEIRSALINRRPRSICTWSHIREIVARKKYETLKLAGSKEVDEYVKAFDLENNEKQSRIADAEKEISRLNSEIKRLSGSVHSGQNLLNTGNEQNLYYNEIHDIILDIINDSHSTCLSGSRKKHILKSLIDANKSHGEGDRVKSELKKLLKDYRHMDSRLRNELIGLGFDISDDGKHYKMVFQGDNRYKFILPKTSSDHRAGKNCASDIIKKLF